MRCSVFVLHFRTTTVLIKLKSYYLASYEKKICACLIG